MKYNYLCVFCCIGLLGCYRQETQRMVTISSTNAPAPFKLHHPPDQTDPLTWMYVMHIYHCDDGLFHLQTSMSVHGKYETIELARQAKTNWAMEMVEYVKSGRMKLDIPEIKPCGTETN